MPDTDYRFSIGPWNIRDGRDSYSPETRPLSDIDRTIVPIPNTLRNTNKDACKLRERVASGQSPR
jgi:hypothetical protein